MLELEPYIGYGLINLIPDPSNFDLNLMKAMMNMAGSRRRTIESQREMKIHAKLATEDYLNSIHMMPRDVKIRSLVHDFGMPESVATQSIDTLEENARESPLVMLQPIQPGGSSQFIQFSIVPNYEMSLFTAQVTGSVIVTDSETRWLELQSAQHRQMGFISYPWNDAYGKINRIPLDYHLLDSKTKTQHHFSAARTTLKHADELVLANERSPARLERLSALVTQLNNQLGKIDADRTGIFVNGHCRILAPEGGIYDSNVQRLLALSGCLKYDHSVRSVYYVESKV
jgi:hypothetical protein